MSDQPDNRQAYPVLPLVNGTLFPALWMPLAVGRPGSMAAVEATVNREDKTLLVVPQGGAGRGDNGEPKALADLHPIGVLAVIRRLERGEEALQIIVQGLQRVELNAVEPGPDHALQAQVTLLPDPTDQGPEQEALAREMLDLARVIAENVAPQAKTALGQIVQQNPNPLHQAYLIASLVGLDQDKGKRLLSADTRHRVLSLMNEFLSYERQVAELRGKIASQTQASLGQQQREALLRQQLKAIQEELGEKSPEQADADELRRRLDEIPLPDHVRQEAEKTLGRLERMSANAPDFQINRSHLELILDLPWQTHTEDNLDLDHARQILDQDHFDLEDIKDRIIEHLAVMRLNPEARAPILCFGGPPGVGKTSLGQSIARALGRKFERFSLGGLHDEAELRGHRRTYIGAMPGRIIQALRRAGAVNPLLMLDEVDKLGRDFRGDPAAALLEILDPAQNFEFRDNYLDLPFDLSKVFFITTANALEAIPRPLLDRMEVLNLAGYSDAEKTQIARRYLIPRQCSRGGIDEAALRLDDGALRALIRRYTREAGVRELERQVGRLVSKLATHKVRGQELPAIDEATLGELLGPPRFAADPKRSRLAPGVAGGLAWTESGGEVLYVEAVTLPEAKGEFTLTGQLGAVMQESARAAHSYLRAHAPTLGLDPKAMGQHGVHIHVPAGATPKDGPSAGVTMATALASLYAQRPARDDTAMTGEITLSGLVLPVGGIKEKVLAAHRNGMKRVILPAANRQDLRTLPDHVKDQLEFHFAETLDDVLAQAMPGPKGQLESSQAPSVAGA
ncbi:MAG: endopeptidase La [Candidatus Competibacterales bacterium]